MLEEFLERLAQTNDREATRWFRTSHRLQHPWWRTAMQMRRRSQNCGCLAISASGWREGSCQSRFSMNGSSRNSSTTDGEKADSIEAIEKHSGSFWSIFEGATLLPSHSRFVMALRWPQILNRYEKHLRSERGVVTSTVMNYLPFARKFLVERFRRAPYSFAK